MSAIQIADRVFSVGVKDPNLTVFDIVMATKHGTTYNSYLIRGNEKTALIDGVKAEFTDESFANIAAICPISEIDYLVVNHNEPDHSGSIPALLDRNPNLKLYCSAPAVPFLTNIINRESSITGFKDNQTLELGGKTLVFKLMPYMHWPDTMMEFLSEEGILFSNDGFATHLCTDTLYADEANPTDLEFEFKYYFDSIMRPFTGYMRRNLVKLDELDIRMLAPSHGPVYRKEPRHYIDKYKTWAADKSEGKNLVTVFYASNYGNTRLLAETIRKDLATAGFATELVDASVLNEELFRDRIETSKAVLIGTPTFNGDAVKPIWDLVNLFSTVYSIGKKAAVFGSYGWGGEGAKLVAERLAGLKMKVFEDNFRVRLIPSSTEMHAIDEYTQKLVEFIGK